MGGTRVAGALLAAAVALGVSPAGAVEGWQVQGWQLCSVSDGARCPDLGGTADAETLLLGGIASIEPGVRGRGYAHALGHATTTVTPPANSSSIVVTLDATVLQARASEFLLTVPATGVSVDDRGSYAMFYVTLQVDQGCEPCPFPAIAYAFVADSAGPRAPREHNGGSFNLVAGYSAPEGQTLGDVRVQVVAGAIAVAGYQGFPSIAGSSASGQVRIDGMRVTRTA